MAHGTFYSKIFSCIDFSNRFRVERDFPGTDVNCKICLIVASFVLEGERETNLERETETDRQADRQTDRQAGRQADRQRHRDRDTQRDTETETERQTKTETPRAVSYTHLRAHET